jgi:predicted metal-dependent enzyme (double-stranded beta helix superfamily)
MVGASIRSPAGSVGATIAGMFAIDQFIADCRVARRESEPRLAVRDVVVRAVADPSAVGDVLRPDSAGLTMLFHDEELTILNVVWAPHMSIHPHDHRMWAVIGIYAGQEDNAFFRRESPGARTLVESGGKQLAERDVAVLGDDTIHGVTNPRDVLTAAIHVYGGDFVNEPRSQWGPGARIERPYDIAQAQQHFADANARWQALPER